MDMEYVYDIGYIGYTKYIWIILFAINDQCSPSTAPSIHHEQFVIVALVIVH